MSAQTEEQQIASLFDKMAVVRLKRRDVIVFRCPGKLSTKQRETALAVLEDAFGKDAKTLLLEGGQELSIARQPGWIARLWNRATGNG